MCVLNGVLIGENLRLDLRKSKENETLSEMIRKALKLVFRIEIHCTMEFSMKLVYIQKADVLESDRIVIAIDFN